MSVNTAARKVGLWEDDESEEPSEFSTSSQNSQRVHQKKNQVGPSEANPLIKNTRERSKCRRFFQKFIGCYICHGCILGFLVGCIALAIILTLWFTAKPNSHVTETTATTTSATTATTVSTTSSTSTSTTATTATTTTTTTTTSTTTSTSATTTTTSTTSTTTTTSATTTTTSTTSTSATTTTTTRTTTTSTTTTTAHPCLGSRTYSTQLLSLNLSASLSWTKYTFNYTAPNTASANLVFVMRNDPLYWYLDDVLVTNSSGSQLLVNGGFETGGLTGWSVCNPNSAGGSRQVSLSNPRFGMYSYQDGSVTHYCYLSQNFTILTGSVYTISFWLNSAANRDAYARALVLA